jgi:chemotaxis protein histidine kinase CheA
MRVNGCLVAEVGPSSLLIETAIESTAEPAVHSPLQGPTPSAGARTLRGSVAVESHDGQGTTFTLRIPLTLATIEGFVVGAGGERYVIPMEAIVELLELPAEEPRPHGGDGQCPGRGILRLRGEPLPYFRLRSFFGSDGAARTRESVVVLDGGVSRMGMVVDGLLGAQPVVIRPLAVPLKRWLTASQALSVSTILNDGRSVASAIHVHADRRPLPRFDIARASP